MRGCLLWEMALLRVAKAVMSLLSHCFSQGLRRGTSLGAVLRAEKGEEGHLTLKKGLLRAASDRKPRQTWGQPGPAKEASRAAADPLGCSHLVSLSL